MSGTFWALGKNTPVDSNGNFHLSASVGVVTPYVDVNRNGTFERFVEPSGLCQRVKNAWQCAMPKHKATLHRTISMRDGVRHDSTYVFWEAYNQAGIRDTMSKLCVADQCTELRPGPFLSPTNDEVQEFSICGDEGFSPTTAQVHLDGNVSALPISQPPELLVTVTASQRADAFKVKIDVNAADRLLMWAGSSDQLGEVQRVYWHSEEVKRNIKIAKTDRGFDVQVPRANVAVCKQDPACVLAIQVVKYWPTADESVVNATEFRTVVDFRNSP